MPNPWYRRFLDNLPPLSDRDWAVLFMLMLVLLGFVLGAALCHWQHALPRPGLQQRLDTLEQRVRHLEQR